ncbi:hypothetical protein MRS44_012249 [Fusarium solani]|uniref:uncharacterized protein n=1 Tax=Fusarium solani TaxID=169388 RepID=UPI0032C3E758|nr:hypothetical protein MRS44_012249 [Fusarium solani]
MTLSNRALEAEEGSKGMVIWDVITNLWDQSNPDGIVSLGVAENTLMHDVLKKHIHDNIALSNLAFTYGDGTTGTKRAKQAVARFLTKQLKPFRAIEPAHISMTNGCSAAIEHLSWAISDPGDAILLGQPYYGTFIPDLTCRFGAKLLPVPFDEVDPLGDDAVAKYEEVIVDAQKKGVLIGLMKLCQKYQVHFISDEIYALSTWPNTVDTNPPPVPFESALTIDTTGVIDPSLVHVLWGMSKDFGANGIRVGALISQANPSLHTALVAVGLYSSVSSISDHVTINLLEDDAFVESYMAENRKKLATQYERAVSWAKKNNITYAPGVNAAFFLWVDLGKAYKARHTVEEKEDITALVMKELLEKKVFLASGEAFGSERPGWFRIVFSHPDEYLDMGLERVVEALQ